MNLGISNLWAGRNQAALGNAFHAAHVNFTHWIVQGTTYLREYTYFILLFACPVYLAHFRELLANLWARGAALQCCFNQESIDFLIPAYFGLVSEKGVFDPSRLSVVVGRVKYKSNGAAKSVSDAIRPFGTPHDLQQPLPYLALLMKPGNEADYNETHSKMKSTAAGAVANCKFAELTNNLISALDNLQADEDLGDEESLDVLQAKEY